MASSRPLGVLAVGLVLLGGLVTGAYVRERSAAKVSGPEVHALRPDPVAGPLEAVPERRPDFHLKDPDGKTHSIAEWDGKPLLVNFWATWCAPCRREIPLLNTLLARADRPADLAIVGVAVDFPDDVRAFMKKVGMNYPVLIGEQDGLDAAAAFGVQQMAFPFTAFIDRRGRVLSVHLGELHERDALATLAVLKNVDSGALTIAEGRAQLQRALVQDSTTGAPPAAAVAN